MNECVFTESLRRIYAAFSKSWPSNAIVDAAFRRVRDLPEDFMGYAENRLLDEVSLPANLGRYLLRELWPYYAAKNSLESAKQGCPRCEGGWRPVYRPGEIYPAGYYACPCNTDPRFSTEPKPDDWELKAMGFVLKKRELPAGTGDRYREIRDATLRKMLGDLEAKTARQQRDRFCEENWAF